MISWRLKSQISEAGELVHQELISMSLAPPESEEHTDGRGECAYCCECFLWEEVIKPAFEGSKKPVEKTSLEKGTGIPPEDK